MITLGEWFYENGCVYAIKTNGDRVRLAIMDREEPGTRPTERDANAKLMAVAKRALELILDIEWVYDDYGMYCWACDGYRDDGHHPQCERQALLAQLEGMLEDLSG